MILTTNDHDLGRSCPAPMWRKDMDVQRRFPRFASRFRRLTAKSNIDLPRAQFVPNMARNGGHSRSIRVSPFLCI
jgi:hypothetical protein